MLHPTFERSAISRDKDGLRAQDSSPGGKPMTPDAARQKIQRELMAGESLLWTGIPRQGFQLRSSDAMTIPFSLLWGGFAFFWETMVLTTNSPWFFKLWGIPFVLVGVYLIIGRFALDSAEREKTAYGLTNTRAIIVSGLRSRTVKSLTLRAQSDISLTESPDGSGTILFGTASMHGRVFLGPRTPWPGLPVPPAFEMIEDAKTVYSTIRSAQAAA